MMSSDLTQDSRISRVVELALIEDVGLGDLTSEALVSETSIGHAEILCKEDGVIAGNEIAALVFRHCDQTITLETVVRDGNRALAGDVVARVNGRAKGILTGERTALNFLQRMSGIATLTRRYVDAVEGTAAKITDTRKTVPGLRVLDKLAVRLGGGSNHRFGLDDMVLIKDNHVFAVGGIRRAVQRCRDHLTARNIQVALEVETKNLEEVLEAVGCEGISRIMLDNFPLSDMRRAVELVGGRVELEASGGITLDTVRMYAETGVDLISIGALTHSAKALDLSLELTSHV
ncbi:MAG: carboxylating nicotinate-nucleotide diphosphorylase [Bacteroidota bacterium]